MQRSEKHLGPTRSILSTPRQEEEVKELMKVLGFIVALTIIAGAILIWITVASAEEPENDGSPEEWEEFEVDQAMAEAGEEVSMPGEKDFGKPWKKKCPSNDGWCPSISEGVSAALVWCDSEKCRKNHLGDALEIYGTWGPWIDEDCGGQPGILPSQTIRTESHVGSGEKKGVFAMTKSGTKECGLASVDRDHAKGLDINACQPRANIFGTCWYRNNRLLALREKLPDVSLAPLEDQWIFAGAGGAVGLGKVITLIQKSGALATKKDGTLVNSSPAKRLVTYLQTIHGKWGRARKVQARSKSIGLDAALKEEGLTTKQWNYLKGFLDLYSSTGPWSSIFGFRPGRTAFRIVRVYRVVQMLKTMYPDGVIPWGEPVLPKRPEDLLSYPGDKLHCACGNWPELEDDRPSAEEMEVFMTNSDFPILVAP